MSLYYDTFINCYFKTLEHIRRSPCYYISTFLRNYCNKGCALRKLEAVPWLTQLVGGMWVPRPLFNPGWPVDFLTPHVAISECGLNKSKPELWKNKGVCTIQAGRTKFSRRAKWIASLNRSKSKRCRMNLCTKGNNFQSFLSQPVPGLDLSHSKDGTWGTSRWIYSPAIGEN